MSINIFSFDRYEVYPVRDYGVEVRIVEDDKAADFYCLYGWTDAGGFYTAIGDYENRFDAEIVADVLSDKKRCPSPSE